MSEKSQRPSVLTKQTLIPVGAVLFVLVMVSPWLGSYMQSQRDEASFRTNLIRDLQELNKSVLGLGELFAAVTRDKEEQERRARAWVHELQRSNPEIAVPSIDEIK